MVNLTELMTNERDQERKIINLKHDISLKICFCLLMNEAPIFMVLAVKTKEL